MRLLDWLCGTATVRFSARERRVYTAQLLRAGIRAVGIRNLDDGGLSVTLTMRDLRRLRELSSERGLPLPAAETESGLPCLLSSLRQRPGLLAGAAAALTILILSTTVVWRVDVICLDNAQGTAERDRVDVTAIREELAAEGIGQGMFLPGFAARHAENRFLLTHDDISWMAINRSGTVLSVEVRPAHIVSHDEETALTGDTDGYLHGTNLVADADGRILSFAVRGGQVTIVPEQMVLRGQLLASGIYTSETGDVVAGRAHGEVMAETLRILTAEIPLTERSICPDGTVRTTRTLCLFGHEIASVVWPLPSVPEIVTFLETFRKTEEKSGIDEGSCGIIADEAISDARELPLCLPDGLPLPVSLRVTTRTGVTESTRVLTEEEARQRAAAALDAQEAALEAERILSREETAVREGDILKVTRYVFCVDNIAASEEYRIKAEE